ncbi:MAG: LicD family protein [Clostridia bacterium]|nr:LicD family protein [Clostridia bacterium]
MNQENSKKPMTMEEIHQSQMDIIRYIDKLCRDNNIKYSLAYGTLLGAIRHKGFIPWDDDMDIMMERVDYNKFLDIMKKDKSDRFNVINYENAYFPWTKICDGNTYIIEKDDYRIPNYALWVDVFPIDEMPEPNSEECKKHLKNLQTIKNKAKYRALTFGFARKKSFVKCIMITLYKLPLQFFSITHFGKKWNEVFLASQEH